MEHEIEILMNGNRFKQFYEKEYEKIRHTYQLRKIDIEILYFLQHYAGHDTSREIIEYNCFTKGHVSQSLDRLCKLDLVHTIKDQEDHRYMHILLSERGKRVVDEVGEIRCRMYQTLFHGVTEEEKDTLYHIARKLVGNINTQLD